MSFQVTARRWRPQTFDEVVGQEHVSATLKSAIENDRVAHAYLFAGTRGVGKTTTARILAKALNCEEGPTPEPCNKCTLCIEVTEGGSMDVIEIDGASNRGIEEIRNLRENARYAPAKGRYKVYIIDEVHMLTMHAFNALLKTLEEPPPNVIFVLATTEVNRVPATILSRCQHFDFRLIPQSQISEQLRKIDQMDGLGVPPAALELIARNARGSMRDAQSLLDQLVSYGGGKVTTEDVMAVLGMVDYDALSSSAEALINGDAAALLRGVEELRVNGRDHRKFCGQLLYYLRDLIVVKVAGDAASLPEVPSERRETMAEQAGRVPLERLQLLFSMLAKAEGEMTRSSYPDLILEMALIKMSKSESFMALGEILSRLEELEGRMKGGGGVSGMEAQKQGALSLEGVAPPPEGKEGAPAGRRYEPLPGYEAQEEREQGLAPGDEPQGGASLVREPRDAGASEGGLWERILKEAKKMNHLEQYLVQGWLVSVNEKEVEIAFSEEYRFNAQLLKQLGKLPELQEAVCRALGRRVNVKLRGMAPEQDAEEAEEEESEEAARPWNPVEEPLVRHVLNMFEGRITDGGTKRPPV